MLTRGTVGAGQAEGEGIVACECGGHWVSGSGQLHWASLTLCILFIVLLLLLYLLSLCCLIKLPVKPTKFSLFFQFLSPSHHRRGGVSEWLMWCLVAQCPTTVVRNNDINVRCYIYFCYNDLVLPRKCSCWQHKNNILFCCWMKWQLCLPKNT